MMKKNSFIRILFISLLLTFRITAQEKTVLTLELTNKTLPFGIIEKVPTAMPKLGLALSGGGSRSLSQIGVLKALEDNNIPIEYVIGTSMGSIIGGLYSAGYKLSELDSMMKATNWEDFFSSQQSNRNELFIDQKVTEDKALVSFRLEGLKLVIPTSLSSGQRAANFLNLMTIGAPIYNDDSYDLLKYKFRAISSDLVSGKEVIIHDGPLGAALRASSSVTLLLPPVKKDSMLLVDGGLVANVPVRETKELGADIVIAVNASSPLYDEQDLNVPWRIADQLVSIPMRILNDQQLSQADLIITPPLGNKKNSDFNEIDTLIKLGYTETQNHISEINNKFVALFKHNLKNDSVFYNLNLSATPTDFDKKVFDIIPNKNSVSGSEILFAIYNIFKEGFWKNASVEITKTENSSIFKTTAEENPPLRQINLTGTNVIPTDSILNSFKYLLDKPFNSQKTFTEILNVLRTYKRNGYSFARVEKVEYDSTTYGLNIKINEGVITKITVVGNSKTKETIITREFPLKVGDYFKFSMAEKGLTNLRSTNLFDQIELSVVGVDGDNELVISLLEKVSSLIRLGMRIDNEYQAQFSADIRDENFNGTGTEMGATFSGGIKNQSYSIEQKANRVFDSFLTYKLRGFYESVDINNYDFDTQTNPKRYTRSSTGEYRQIYYGGSFGIGAQVQRFGNLLFEARYQRDEIENIQNFSDQTYKTDISSFRISLNIDSQNQYPYPSKGFFINSYYETAQAALGGEISYTKFLFDYKVYFGLRSDHVWCFRTMIGSADKTLPLSQQFSIGGQNSFFGMREYEYRGRQIYLSSLEVRYQLPFKMFFDTYIRARYDIGSIWKEREQIRLKNLQHGVGATISFKTPIGPADFSVGKSFYFANTLSKNKIVFGPTYFYFTIGYYY